MDMQTHLPVVVEVFTPNPLIFNECVECEFIWRDIDHDDPIHRRRVLSQLPPGQAQDYLNMSIWVEQLLSQYGNQVKLRVVDADSLEGITKSGQYGINSYPAIVVDRRYVYTANSLGQATKDVATLMCEMDAVPC